MVAAYGNPNLARDDGFIIHRFSAGRMAGKTIIQVGHSFLDMGNDHLIPIMAAVTGVFGVRAAVAGFTGFDLI
jgi:hypothetical protein